MITAFGNVEAAVEALKAGAFDFVAKPLDINVLRGLVRQALELNNKRQAQPDEASRLLGNSEPMVALRQTIAKVARSQAPVHISGESGTRKERVAPTNHAPDAPDGAPSVHGTCRPAPSDTIASQLLVHPQASIPTAPHSKT